MGPAPATPDLAGWHLVAGRTPRALNVGVRRSWGCLVQGVAEGVAEVMAAGDDPQAAAVLLHDVEVEGDLQRDVFAVRVPVGVPVRVTYVEVAVAGRVVEVVAQERGGDALYAGVVEERAEVLVLVDERDQRRPALVVVAVLPCPPLWSAQTFSNASVTSSISSAKCPGNVRKPKVRK